MARNRVPNVRLRALIDESGWTQDGLARTVNAVGAEIGLRLRYDRTSVAHWLAGSRPVERAVPVVCEALSRRTRRVITPERAGFTPPAPALARQRTGDADRRLNDLLCGLSSATPYRPADAWPGSRSLATGAFGAAAGTRTGRVCAVPDAVAFFTRALVTQGGGFARETLRVYLSEALWGRLREESGEAWRRTCVEASQLTLLLGRMHADDVQQGAAQRCYLLAWELAVAAGCREAAVIAVRTLSAQAYALGHVRVADAAARAASRAATSAPLAVRGFAYAQLAVTAASRGERTETLRALSLAETAITATEGRHGPAFESYARGDFEYRRAEALLALGDTREGIRALENALASRARDDRRGTAMTRLRLAAVLLSLGRVEEARHQERVGSEEARAVRSLALSRGAQALRSALAGPAAGGARVG